MTARLFARSGVVARCIYLVNSSRYLPHLFWLGAAALWLMAALLRCWVAPAFELLPTDYVAETGYAAKLWPRQTLSSAAEESESIVRRRDQTLRSRDGHSIIQGDAHWLTPAGVAIFETFNVYGVDRSNRQNLADYGNKDRAGQNLFPPHFEKKQYDLWDPDYAGPRIVTFDHLDMRALELWLPLTFAAAGLIWIAAGFYTLRRGAK